MMTVQIGLFLKSMHSDGRSAILYWSTNTTQNSYPDFSAAVHFIGIKLHHWRHFLDIVNVFRIWSTLVGFQELALGFEPSRNGKIFWISNKLAYLRKILFRSSSSNGRIPPDKNTNALSSPGIISSIELPSANVTSLFSRSWITSSLRWAGQQIRNKMFGISGRK